MVRKQKCRIPTISDFIQRINRETGKGTEASKVVLDMAAAKRLPVTPYPKSPGATQNETSIFRF